MWLLPAYRSFHSCSITTPASRQGRSVNKSRCCFGNSFARRLTALSLHLPRGQEPPAMRTSNHHVPLPVRVEGALHYPESDALQFRHEFLVPVRPEGQLGFPPNREGLS